MQHLNVMEDMLKDYVLGEHLLLVGNQVTITAAAKVILYFVRLYTGGWKEQDCGSLPPSYESTQRVSSIA